MADINTIVVGKNYGIVDGKGVKHKVEALKINKKAGTVDVKAGNGAVRTVPADKLKGLQGRPPANGSAAKPVPAAEKPAPKAAPAKPAAKKDDGLSYAELIEKIRDIQNRMADDANELADIIDRMEAFEVPETAAPAKPAKGKAAASKPMAAEEEEVSFEEDGADEIDFD